MQNRENVPNRKMAIVGILGIIVCFGIILSIAWGIQKSQPSAGHPEGLWTVEELKEYCQLHQVIAVPKPTVYTTFTIPDHDIIETNQGSYLIVVPPFKPGQEKKEGLITITYPVDEQTASAWHWHGSYIIGKISPEPKQVLSLVGADIMITYSYW